MLKNYKKNFKGFTNKQVEKAILAQNTQAMMAHPSDNQFKQVVSNKFLTTAMSN